MSSDCAQQPRLLTPTTTDDQRRPTTTGHNQQPRPPSAATDTVHTLHPQWSHTHRRPCSDDRLSQTNGDQQHQQHYHQLHYAPHRRVTTSSLQQRPATPCSVQQQHHTHRRPGSDDHLRPLPAPTPQTNDDWQHPQPLGTLSYDPLHPRSSSKVQRCRILTSSVR